MKNSELDKKIWRQVFGGHYFNAQFIKNGKVYSDKSCLFSSDIKCAWKIIETMRKNGFKIFFSDCMTEDNLYMCFFLDIKKGRDSRKVQDFSESSSCCEAICLAALKSIEKAKTSRFYRKGI